MQYNLNCIANFLKFYFNISISFQTEEGNVTTTIDF